jgi:hypothetical protein
LSKIELAKNKNAFKVNCAVVVVVVVFVKVTVFGRNEM